jgi:hypothetical protein
MLLVIVASSALVALLCAFTALMVKIGADAVAVRRIAAIIRNVICLDMGLPI